MISKEVRKDTILTILSKALIALISIAIVASITQFWGAEGKGHQAIFIANLSLITIVTNVFTNSSISYFVRKVGASKLFAQAFIWTFIISSLGVLISHHIDKTSYSFFLLIACLLTGYITFHNALYIGMQKIKYFNLLTILQPLFLLLFMFLFYKTINKGYFDYFYAYIFSLITVIVIAHFFTKKTAGKIKFQLDFSVTKQTFNYGFLNELSGFFQFFVTRLSFYFIVYYLGEISLGVFSVGVSISESIWIISRSISLVQYSNIIKEGNTQNARKGVITTSLFSIVFTLFCIVIILLLPKSVFCYVFGNEFSEVKQIILLISPGILFVSFSTIYGHYFAAIGKMKILVFKSIIGALLTFILLLFLISKWEMNGACITNSIVHFVSSAIIVTYFFMMNDKAKSFSENNKMNYD
jgi:O-antigen/teichoic acid export membrane protein